MISHTESMENPQYLANQEDRVWKLKCNQLLLWY